MATCFFQIGDEKRAMSITKHIRELDPTNVEALNAIALFSIRDSTTGDELTAALEKDPTNPFLILTIGNLLFARKDLDRAQFLA
jgi:uncharacterized protein HemY